MTVAITGGGTGGHLIIAKTFAEELSKLDIRCIFIGSTYGQDSIWFKDSDFFSEKYFLQSRGVVNKKGFRKIISLLNILKLAFFCKNIFKKEDVSCVISVGGYSSAPASFGAIIYKIPFFIHEQNAKFGKLNKILKPYAKGFYSSYEKPKFNYPVNEKFFKTARDRKELKTIIFLGGSQGAKFINDLAVELSPNLLSLGYEIIHQCGKSDFQRIQKIYAEKNLNIELIGFCNDMEQKMQKADLCIGRSGASTLWELCANRLPAIFIPFPYAAGDHQYFNAKFLKDMNLTQIIRQENVKIDELLYTIQNYDVCGISSKLKDVIKPESAQIIIKDILSKF